MQDPKIQDPNETHDHEGEEYANTMFKMDVDKLYQEMFHPTSTTMSSVFQHMNFTQVQYTPPHTLTGKK